MLNESRRAPPLRGVIFAAVIGLLGSFGFHNPASAASSLCPAAIADDLIANSGCEVGGSSNDNPTGPIGGPPSATAAVNVDTMFDKSDWVFLGKDESPDGTWDLGDNFFDTYDKGLVVLKGPNAFNYVGYLILEANGTSGTFTTPFDGQDVSHVSYYGQLINGGPGPGPVPLPGALLLMLSALGGLGLFNWWRRRGATA